MEANNSTFINELNKEIDRKIELIEEGKMEPVTKLKKFDFQLSSVIIAASLLALVWAYFYMC